VLAGLPDFSETRGRTRTRRRKTLVSTTVSILLLHGGQPPESVSRTRPQKKGAEGAAGRGKVELLMNTIISANGCGKKRKTDQRERGEGIKGVGGEEGREKRGGKSKSGEGEVVVWEGWGEGGARGRGEVGLSSL